MRDTARRTAVAGAERSGSPVRARVLTGMHIAYVVVTIVVALANGYAAVLNFAGAESVRGVADEVRVSPRWMIPFGILLACGAVGLLAGFAVPVLGMAAAIGLVVYFICAVSAHIRVRDPKVAGASFPGDGRRRPSGGPRLPQPLAIPAGAATPVRSRPQEAEREPIDMEEIDGRRALPAAPSAFAWVAYRMLGSVGEADDALQEAPPRNRDQDPRQRREHAGLADHHRRAGVPEHAARPASTARTVHGRLRARPRCQPRRKRRP